MPERAANIGQSRVVNDTTVQIVWMLMAMTGWAAHVVDVNSAFCMVNKTIIHQYLWKLLKALESKWNGSVFKL